MKGLRGGVTLETRHVTQGAGFADVGHPADCGPVTPGAGPEKGVTMETADV